MKKCPLCYSIKGALFYQGKRTYYRCPVCDLTYVLADQFLSAEAEKAHYDLHENAPADLRYRQFLSRLYAPLQARLSPQSIGLDFGSGPGPTLSIMFEEAGHKMTIYDPFYAPDSRPWERHYDFITASEVVEHLHRPRYELDRLWHHLKPGGWLGVMTKRAGDQAAFAKWHYKNDPTHVTFFSEETFRWLAAQWDANLIIEGKDVVLLQKPQLSTVS